MKNLMKDPTKTREDFHEWFRNPKTSNPKNYLPLEAYHIKRSNLLLKTFNEHISKNDNIIELGCNVGRNLDFLWRDGYRKLNGIEMQKEAITLMKKTYPEMSNNISIHHAFLEKLMPAIKDDFYDTTFTMAVLLHIHPTSEFIFKEMVRTTKKFIVLIEDEPTWPGYKVWRAIGRKYKPIFENLGCTEIYHHRSNKTIDGLNRHYHVRVFRVNPKGIKK